MGLFFLNRRDGVSVAWAVLELCVDHAGLELTEICLHLSDECWGQRCEPLYLALKYVFLKRMPSQMSQGPPARQRLQMSRLPGRMLLP